MNKIENEFTNAFEKLFTANPMNMQDAAKNVAEYNAKFSKIALDAAKKNAALSQAWANDTLGKMEALTKVQGEPADYAKVATDFVSAQTQASPEHVAAFTEVAKKAQADTVELMLAAGKEFQAEAAEVAKTASKQAA